MYYGFDIGGTKIEFGAFNEKLERVATERVPTPGDDYDKLVDILVDIIEKADREFGTQGQIGIGIPGMEDAEDGALLTSNVPAAKGRFLRKDLESRIGRSVQIDNDANCFALSEAWDSELQGEKSVLGLILGTGFGGGIVIDGQVFSGKNHVAGELGHTRMPIDAWFHLGEKAPLFECGCNNKGCIDNYLSGRGFEQLYAHYYGENLKAVDIIKQYGEGEVQAVEHVDRFMEMLAICLANLFTAFDPHVVVLGGGLSNFDLLYSELPKRLPKHLLSVARVPKIIKAKHGDAGGVRGAAFLNIR
ncbi:N-acetylglucosamine kinase [Photobacterium ganghwense]|uniref:N-acetyl-D-glucosamine kinase n=1 Tax=Photobacterium ganghwense TaxID=320778 RepID=A0A0J1HAA4_9GAMM|nr:MULTISPECIES: N-acetylglucosamine kinase [Photobacterium]KLV08609.1 N-acetylglucosamine kinase [Photobacterium ganghwense]PSU10725.1 N-acetylglucosamine kinase [Photobacterium ganghwense]QSV12869.1 N-acetylglucosamine kinase [Photobacterium ganghwense]